MFVARDLLEPREILRPKSRLAVPARRRRVNNAMRLATGEFFGRTLRQLEFQGVTFSTSEYDPHQTQPWHTHERATFFAHLSGEQLDELEDAQWSMPVLGLTYHPSSTPHRSRIGPRGAKGINVELSEEWLERHGISLRDLGERRVCSSPAVRSAALRLIRAYAPSTLADQELSDMALELVESFLSCEAVCRRSSPQWLRETEVRMRARFREPIGLSSLAYQAGIHPVHLARVFRQTHGRSVTEHLQRLRIQAAVDQVLAGESIGMAAVEAGFADQFHFSRTLKAHFGYSPKWVKQLACA